MQREMLKSKIHRVTVTQAELYYEGSITVDKDLLEAADILPYEKVQVLNFNNGSRLDTYTIEGAAGSGTLKLDRLPPDPKDQRVYDLAPLLQKDFNFCYAPNSGIECEGKETAPIFADKEGRPDNPGG